MCPLALARGWSGVIVRTEAKTAEVVTDETCARWPAPVVLNLAACEHWARLVNWESAAVSCCAEDQTEAAIISYQIDTDLTVAIDKQQIFGV